MRVAGQGSYLFVMALSHCVKMCYANICDVTAIRRNTLAYIMYGVIRSRMTLKMSSKNVLSVLKSFGVWESINDTFGILCHTLDVCKSGICLMYIALRFS